MTWRPQKWPRSNFLIPYSCSTSVKTPTGWYWDIFNSWKNRVFNTSLGEHLKKILYKKILRRTKNLVCRSFPYMSAVNVKWEQKPIKGKQKMKKCVTGSLGYWHQFMIFLGLLRVRCKKPLGNRLRASRSKNDFKKTVKTKMT